MHELTSQELEQIIDASHDGLLVLDAQGHTIVYANPAACELLQTDLDDLLEREFPLLDHDPESDAAATSLNESLYDAKVAEETVRYSRPDGSRVWIQTKIAPLDHDDVLNHVAVCFHDVTEQVERAEEFRTQSLQTGSLDLHDLVRDDKLTGIFNRRYFEELLLRNWSAAQDDETTLSVFLMDIDHFERYNETFGRQAADSCLRLVAKAISGALRRGTDVGARYGGEEFVALTSGMTTEQAMDLGERIAARVRDLCIHHPKSKLSKYVTVSIGVATVVVNPKIEPQDVITAAETALLEAKDAGRNRVVSAAVD